MAVGLHDQPVGNDERQAMALRCYEAGLRQTVGEAPGQFPANDYIDEFKRRLAQTDWRVGALKPENFTASPGALVRWAPIADKLKKFDAEIVENSVKFSWREIREQFRKRIDARGAWRRLVAASHGHCRPGLNRPRSSGNNNTAFC